MNARSCLLVAALALAAAVALGAFGAHALKAHLGADMLATYQTAVQYHFWHALGLLGVGVLMMRSAEGTGATEAAEAPALAWIAWLLVAGLLLFSGSLYLLALTGATWLGAVTPLGGVAFIAAWLGLAWWAWRL
jgi:uncharacterized membrane protein YgdD (TMEM256/DUF423 family)